MDQIIKKYLGIVLRHQDLCSRLLSYWKAKDIEQGIFSLPQDLILVELKPLILAKYPEYLKDFSIDFRNGFIQLELDLVLKQAGKLKARYQFSVIDFSFSGKTHIITAGYLEDVGSEGDMLQKMLVKSIALTGKTWLQKAAEKTAMQGIKTTKDLLELDFDQIKQLSSFPLERISLQYLDSQDGSLRLSFSIQ